MDEAQLADELLRLRKEQFQLRMQKASGQLGQTHLLAEARRDLARTARVPQNRARGSVKQVTLSLAISSFRMAKGVRSTSRTPCSANGAS